MKITQISRRAYTPETVRLGWAHNLREANQAVEQLKLIIYYRSREKRRRKNKIWHLLSQAVQLLRSKKS